MVGDYKTNFSKNQLSAIKKSIYRIGVDIKVCFVNELPPHLSLKEKAARVVALDKAIRQVEQMNPERWDF